MKVLDADDEMLKSFCSEAIDFFNLGEKRSVLIIGVESGGVPIAEALFEEVKNLTRTSISFVRCSRPSTKKKKEGVIGRIFRSVIRIFPKFFLNFLRNVEHSFLSLKRPPEREVTSILADYSEYDTVIVVDDAVDSGYSLKSVVSHIMDLAAGNASDVSVRSAVFVVTQKNPVFEPDFSFKKGVLVRFPWALDA
ncbi:phosphoribosyltransferase family protein [uncultured Marinobacter sp.]|uniref:phosphoribosyltransferase family protein n=1 Tax=uncultured Marinobacter sp. TaxID=187379 RepID=UPI002355C712